MGCGSSTSGAEKSANATNDGKPTVLRIIAINDIYQLDNFASIKTVVDKAKAEIGPDNVVCTLAGDFLGPSVLSSLDFGHSMIACMNKVPVDYICFGNHEKDIPYDSLLKRIKEYKGEWVNSNMPGFELKLPEYSVRLVQPPAGSKGPPRKVVFTGLVIGGPKFQSLYGGTEAFGGAVTSIVDVMQAAPLVDAKIRKAHPDLDCIIPITHQDQAEDIKLAESGNYPMIIGGHDHDVSMDSYGAAKVPVVKAGLDGANAAVVDLTWPAGAKPSSKPVVTTKLVSCLDHDPHEDVAKVIFRSLEPVRALKTAKLYKVPAGKTVTTEKSRFGPVDGGTLFATALRYSLRAECCLVNSGSIRGNKTYTDYITFSDLTDEIPFPGGFFAAPLPGKVLISAVQNSRAGWKNGDTAEQPFAMQCDDKLLLKDHIITHVDGAPVDPAKTYLTGLSFYLCKANPDLAAYFKANPDALPSSDAGREPGNLLVEYFCNILWSQLLDEGGDGKISEKEIQAFFHKANKDGDDHISMKELDAAIEEKLGDLGDLVSKQMHQLLDADGDGGIEMHELKALKS